MFRSRFALPEIRSAVEGAAGPTTGWEPLAEGENSQVFAAVAGTGPVVVRVSKRREGFAVDERASLMLAGSGVRVPEFHGIGPIGDGWWCLTGRLPGTRLCDLPMDRITAAAPAVADTLERLHAVDVSGTTGYGGVDPATGDGRHTAWADWIGRVPREWPDIESTEDRKLLEALAEQVHAAAASLPPVRALVHGDYSANNLVLDEDGTVGVLDLERAMLGDPLWDAAYQLYWGGAWPPMAPQARAAAAGLDDTADHRNRLRCYMTAAGLAGAAVYMFGGRHDEVHLMARRLAPLLDAPPSLADLDGYWLAPG
ncbi:aminoglycoside phosphotransferase family protein [Glycomyces sp. A-F 0318]|uniref:phosphotransferase family protein n=1 Tax=Glycomyces amatae TaxID=2881355 RepID=UPI001E3FC394|nr:aminoglycoside phosphotransferase family protein [Glycomyces amatae]MCD0445026.1 aminoglycoside phosphotransferase family protein [Glycomyces amatae]